MQTQWFEPMPNFVIINTKGNFNIEFIIMFFHENFCLRCRKTILLLYILQNYRIPLDNFLYFNIMESWIFSRVYVYISYVIRIYSNYVPKLHY
jgi:hypothetical protein